MFFYVFSVFTLTKSNKGVPVINADGYRFNKETITGSKIRWKCASHHQKGCPAILFTTDNYIVLTCKNEHTHKPMEDLQLL